VPATPEINWPTHLQRLLSCLGELALCVDSNLQRMLVDPWRMHLFGVYLESRWVLKMVVEHTDTFRGSSPATSVREQGMSTGTSEGARGGDAGDAGGPQREVAVTRERSSASSLTLPGSVQIEVLRSQGSSLDRHAHEAGACEERLERPRGPEGQVVRRRVDDRVEERGPPVEARHARDDEAARAHGAREVAQGTEGVPEVLEQLEGHGGVVRREPPRGPRGERVGLVDRRVAMARSRKGRSTRRQLAPAHAPAALRGVREEIAARAAEVEHRPWPRVMDEEPLTRPVEPAQRRQHARVVTRGIDLARLVPRRVRGLHRAREAEATHATERRYAHISRVGVTAGRTERRFQRHGRDGTEPG
jgi:hypothetical protein